VLTSHRQRAISWQLAPKQPSLKKHADATSSNITFGRSRKERRIFQARLFAFRFLYVRPSIEPHLVEVSACCQQTALGHTMQRTQQAGS